MALHKNYINGEWVEGKGVRENINPSDVTDVVGEYAQADAAQAEAAIAAAKAAQPGWAASTPQAKADALEAIGIELLARKDELGTLLAREEGKTAARGIGETVRAGQIFKFFAGEALRVEGERARLGAPRRRRRDHPRAGRRRRPDLALELPDRHSGLEDRAGAGLRQHAWCSSPPTWCRAAPGRWPRSSARAGLPAGRVQPRHGPRLAWSARRCWTTRDVNAISFTGSVETGGRVAQACAARAPSSSSRWAARTRWWCWTTPISTRPSTARCTAPSSPTGQRCTASSRLIVHARASTTRFVAALVERDEALKVDDALKRRHRDRPGGRRSASWSRTWSTSRSAASEGARAGLGRRAPRTRDTGATT